MHEILLFVCPAPVKSNVIFLISSFFWKNIVGGNHTLISLGLQLSDDDDGHSSGTDYDENDIYAVKKTEDFKLVKGQPGMFYKVCFFLIFLLSPNVWANINPIFFRRNVGHFSQMSNAKQLSRFVFPMYFPSFS